MYLCKCRHCGCLEVAHIIKQKLGAHFDIDSLKPLPPDDCPGFEYGDHDASMVNEVKTIWRDQSLSIVDKAKALLKLGIDLPKPLKLL